MTSDLFERELRYQTMLAICRSLTKSGGMTPEILSEAEKLLNEKYHPVFRAQ